MRIADLTQKYHKPAIAICATSDKFDLFESQGVTAMFNTFIDMPETYTDFEWAFKYAITQFKLLNYLKRVLINKSILDNKKRARNMIHKNYISSPLLN